MSGHTPGPWSVVHGGKHWNNPAIENLRIHAPSGERGHDIAWSPDGELVAEHVYEEADARLIAAAPELLEALILLEAEMVASGNAGSRDFGWPVAIRKTRDAIAKAAGAQP